MQNKGKGKTNSGFEGKINDPMYVFSSSFHFPFYMPQVDLKTQLTSLGTGNLLEAYKMEVPA